MNLFVNLAIRIISYICIKNKSCRKCRFGTLWNGCKLMELSPDKWKNELNRKGNNNG
jgi:hypothetical protein